MEKKFDQILDKIQTTPQNNQIQVKKIIKVSIFYIFILILVEVFKNYNPEHLTEYEETKMKVISILDIIIIAIIPILISNYLNRIKRQLPIFKIITITGSIFFGMEIIYKTILSNIYLSEGYGIDYTGIFTEAGLTALLSIAIANFRINQLRKRNMFFPVIILIATFLLVCFLIVEASG